MTTPLEKSQAGLDLLKQAIIQLLRQHEDGLTNIEIAHALKLESDYEGERKNFLSWSILGLLVNEGSVRYTMRGRSRLYSAKTDRG